MNNEKLYNKLSQIYIFLKQNKKYNSSLQFNYYQRLLSPHSKKKDKVFTLLYNVANSQKAPKMDMLTELYKKIYETKDATTSMRSFISCMGTNNRGDFSDLYYNLIDQKGIGPKTAALFCKCIYQIHNNKRFSRFEFWADSKKRKISNGQIFLPVDRVIISIFNRLDPTISWDYKKINAIINNKYTSTQIVLWDDLWFWGYLSQNSQNNDTQIKYEWNEAKYWGLPDANKNPRNIEKIKSICEKFIQLSK